MITFPSVTVTDLEVKDPMFGDPTEHASLPCMFCMFRGEFDRYKLDKRATKLVEVADLVKLPLCAMHAEEFMGDKR